MAKKTKKQLKIEQANMQSDSIEMGAWSTEEMSSDGIQNTGDFTYSFADLDDEFSQVNTAGVVNTVSVDPGLTYDIGDLGQLDMFDEMDMRDKYPALNQAWEHYQSVLEVCKTKEKEENED